MFPVILIATWHTALHLMHAGDWCWRVAPGRFACTAYHKPPYLQVLATKVSDLPWLLRHGYACTGTIRHWWVCTPR
jgi:hypothetical protein